MYSSSLTVNQLVEIEVSSHGRVFRSRVEEVSAKGICLAVPMASGALVPLHIGEEIKVNYVYKKEVHSFVTRVKGRRLYPIPVLIVDHPREVVRIQRRNWVRLEVSLPVHFQLLQGHPGTVGEGSTIDISGGGVSLRTRVDWLKVNDTIRLWIQIPEREPFLCTGRVVRISHEGAGRNLRKIVAVQFKDIREGQRELLIAYIFEKQRELIRKGLG